MAKAIGIKNPDHIAVPVPSLYGEQIITFTEVILGLGSLNSTRLLFNLPFYATSASDFQILNGIYPFRCCTTICANFNHPNKISFPQIQDNRIRVLIRKDAFIAAVSLNFTTGPPATPYGVLTQLGWTVTGPIPQKYKPNSNKQVKNYNIELYNRIKNAKNLEKENNMLQIF